ncbi:MAG: VOC family protein [Pyrinomonadaceae bacterium]
MNVTNVTAQLRTTDLDASIDFYTNMLGFELEFRYEDFYAGIRAGRQSFHLKFACDKDPSIDYVDEQGHFHLYFQTDNADGDAAELEEKGVEIIEDVHNTDWQTREFVIKDDQGHTLYFGQPLTTD